ncbi:glycopeptide antibiotics resistance protein [Bacillus sp. SORGH_AS 510]|uniref:VanZ family protein n=1 Tax=Bacillus sp. SORGH_AS_0510 TaxID=3041771 RepID=UPI0027875721|nr:VanZ family protein [Bacillus sp. SORGH_AS_0510]MDQ1145937.1 glycopeptide antibiotics resistance protein [Bacillus sp. SORGH_AS_0510]
MDRLSSSKNSTGGVIVKNTYTLALFLSVVTFLVLSPIFFRLINYLHPVVLLVVLSCIYLTWLGLLLLIRKESIRISYSLLLTFIIIYSIGLLILLFFRPNDQSYESVNLEPFTTISFYLSGKVDGLISFYNLAANIGLFLPYGILLRIKHASIARVLIAPIISITVIELLQFFTHRGSMDIDDLILNVLGIYLGCILYPIFKKIVKIPNY